MAHTYEVFYAAAESVKKFSAEVLMYLIFEPIWYLGPIPYYEFCQCTVFI
jgi:hypothetical protein